MNKMHNKDWLVVANGSPLARDVLAQLALNRKIMALDGAVSDLLRHHIQADIVLGDFDSIDKALLSTLQTKTAIQCLHAPDQNATDLTKGLQHLQTLQARSVTICQASGHRLDHTLANLRILKRFYKKFACLEMLTATEKIYYLQDENITLRATHHSQPLALLAFPQASISSQGLHYDMTDFQLQFAERESTSNGLVAEQADITVIGSALLIISHATAMI